ncbi:MAG: double zinc ribbon domain-containing protein, partial [Candidatus Thorarchaeota archaeon]
MARCVYCKTDMTDTDRYCPKCGSDMKPWVCPACSEHIRLPGITKSQCNSCGKELKYSDLRTEDGKGYSMFNIYGM